jgi:hypothetical protein
MLLQPMVDMSNQHIGKGVLYIAQAIGTVDTL